MTRSARWVLCAAGVAVLATLGGCREDEQDRFRLYRQGLYQGQVDQGLTDAARVALSARGVRQADGGMGPGSGDKTRGDVRPPG